MKTLDTKPVLYCDIDGVLNIKAKIFQDTVHKVVLRKIPFGRLLTPIPVRFKYRTSIVDELASIPTSLFWLTTWNHYAVKILEPLTSLRSEGVLHYKMRIKDIGRERGKYELLKAHQKIVPSPFIWIDNVATKNYNPKDWELSKHPHLVIKPESRFGITEDHLDEIKEFNGSLILS